jgi:hypothetical protein
MIKTKNILIVAALLIVFVSSIFAKGIYQEPKDFLLEVFAGEVPQVKKFWIQKDLQKDINSILGHDLGVLRLSYWQRDNRTAWILEEIGKSLPITVGIVVNDNKIERINILVFRESRGWEIRYPFFTEQFNSAALTAEKNLDKGIDGISGATLSVNAVKKLAALALFFHQQVLK